eukprot:scaffold98802_cov70-Cyclotella_meneghiniana.AAC.2
MPTIKPNSTLPRLLVPVDDDVLLWMMMMPWWRMTAWMIIQMMMSSDVSVGFGVVAHVLIWILILGSSFSIRFDASLSLKTDCMQAVEVIFYGPCLI